MTNFRKRQTWYGAINCYTGQFILNYHKSSKTEYTIEFVKYLLDRFPLSRHVFMWDGASCHVSNKFKDYLKSVNGNLPESEWKIKCIKFAPNAPQQNPVEDIWLYAKTWVRKNFSFIEDFEDAVQLFRDCLLGEYFRFNKLNSYVTL